MFCTVLSRLKPRTLVTCLTPGVFRSACFDFARGVAGPLERSGVGQARATKDSPGLLRAGKLDGRREPKKPASDREDERATTC